MGIFFFVCRSKDFFFLWYINVEASDPAYFELSNTVQENLLRDSCEVLFSPQVILNCCNCFKQQYTVRGLASNCILFLTSWNFDAGF